MILQYDKQTRIQTKKYDCQLNSQIFGTDINVRDHRHDAKCRQGNSVKESNKKTNRIYKTLHFFTRNVKLNSFW